jgi:hypothetical protein
LIKDIKEVLKSLKKNTASFLLALVLQMIKRKNGRELRSLLFKMGKVISEIKSALIV